MIQNYILSQQNSDNINDTLLIICRTCIDHDNDALLKITLESFQDYNQQIHEVIMEYCCSRGSVNCLKILVKQFDYSITSLCFKTLTTFGRKIRYIKCFRLLLEEYELPSNTNLYKDCYDVGMFEYLLSLKLKGVNELNPIILIRFANQLFEEEERIKYPLTVKYLESKSLL